MRCAVLLLLASCWTGSASPARQAPSTVSALPSAFEVTLARTRCFGACPVYQVSIDGDGRVRWIGEEFVHAIGERRATVPLKRIAEIQRMLETVQFFERDVRGELPDPGVDCVRTGNSGSCSFTKQNVICFDGTSAIVTVRKNHHTHTMRNDHCEPSPLDELEALIDDIARTSGWIGERVTD